MSERRPPTCPCCAGHGVPLGALGRLHWFRCRDCGMTFARAGGSKRTPRAPSTVTRATESPTSPSSSRGTPRGNLGKDLMAWVIL